MRFLVCSDSHGRVSHLMEMTEQANLGRFPIDGLLFLGDGLADLTYLDLGYVPIIAVSGNWDLFRSSAKREEVLVMDGYRILMMHGHTHGAHSGIERMVAYADEIGADILLFGHTHVPQERYFPSGSEVGGVTLKKPLYVLNPGSIGSARDGSREGFGTLELTRSGVVWNTVGLGGV
jgi:putative phosphoesterase